MRTDKPLTLYWLANDLMWLVYRIHTRASDDLIWKGVESCDKYLDDLDAPFFMFLHLSYIKSLLISGYSSEALTNLQELKTMIHEELKKQEPDFVKQGYRRDRRLD